MTTTALPPTFLLIGAPKAGTSSLFQYLDQHQDVHRCRFKEPRFFAIEGNVPPELQSAPWLVGTWDEYLELFRGARPEQARGEASTTYLHSAGTVERVRARVPDARLLVILRHPAEAAWSQYLMATRLRQETRPLERMIDEEPLEPRSPQWAYEHNDLVRMRFYHHHLTRWLDVFPSEQVRVFLYEDLVEDAESVVRQAWAHIGVDPGAPLDVAERHNVGLAPRSARLYVFSERPGRFARVLRGTLRRVPGRATVQERVRQWNERPTPPLPAATRERLLDLYRDDTEALEGLLGRDLSAWKR